MGKTASKARKFFSDNLAIIIVCSVALLCALFLFFGTRSENGSITLDGQDAKIEEYTKKFIEDANDALYRIMNQDKPTDETVEADNDEPMGQGFYTTIDDVIGRRLVDGNNDGGNGWQCSRYTAWLATGKWSYSSAHPDYGPVNGKDMAAWLVKNYGYKYIDKPVEGAIGSGGFNTLYGHTVMYLYATGEHTAMVNDANYVPLTVSTHSMNIDGWVWVVPGSYDPQPEPTPEPTPTPTPAPNEPTGTIEYTYVLGDYFSKVLVDLGLDEGKLWGYDGTVQYYTAQLIEQNMLDDYGNVKIGTPFTLTIR